MTAYSNETNRVEVLTEKKIRESSSTASTQTTETARTLDDASRFTFYNRTRILITILSTVCLTLNVANSLALNFTVICMYEEEPSTTTNETEKPHLLYSEAQTSWLFSAIAVGTLMGTLPVGYLTNRFGFRRTFFCYGLISSISTMLLPLASYGGFIFIVIVRVLEGIAVSTSYPAMGSIVAEWSTLKKSGTYFAYLSTHLQLGTIVAMPAAGGLCESKFGWESLYYLLGVTTLIAFVLFYYFYRDSAAMHRNVSDKELVTIQKNKIIHVLEKGERRTIPYRAMLTDYSVLGIIASSIGGGFSFHLFFQYGPIYLNKILRFDIQNTGFAAALPSLLSILVKFVAGPLSDSVPYLSDKSRMIMFASISQFSMAMCMIGLAFVPEDATTLAQCFFTAVTMFSGLNAVGVSKSAQLISGSFAYAVMSVCQFVISFTVISLPLIVAMFAPNNTAKEWSRLFIFAAVLLTIVTVIFVVTCEASPRPWTYGNGQAPKLPDKVAPVDVEKQPSVFDISEKTIASSLTIDGILRQDRSSIISKNNEMRASNLSLFEVSLEDPEDGEKPSIERII